VRAAVTRVRILAEDSATPSAARLRYGTGGTSTCRSKRSRRGREMRPRYFFPSRGMQAQGWSGLPRWPQGQGFIAPTSVRRAGKVTDMVARAIVTTPSSDSFRIITICGANYGRMAGTVPEEPHHHQSGAAGDAGKTVVSNASAWLIAGRMVARRRGTIDAPVLGGPCPCFLV
jgi:hypothetical protein